MADPPQDPTQSVSARSSNEMVRLYKENFGRGPTKARTNITGNGDIVLCTLEDSLTPAEQSMVKMGEHQRLRDVRMFFQYATEDQFTQVIEEATGRKVKAFVSGIDTKEDVSCELFYLEPRDAA